MQISFNPPLEQVVRVSVLPGVEEVQLSCRATFVSADDLEEFRRSGAKVELWSNFPIAGRPGGDWNERVFRETEDKERLALELGSSHDAIILGGSDGGSNQNRVKEENSLFLEFDVVVSEQVQFEYTYRMVFPSGEIRWLGDFGRNGYLWLEKGDDRVSLGKGWNMQPDGDFLWETNPDSSDDSEIEVAQLSADFDYDIRLIGTDDSGSLVSDALSGPLCIVIPRLNAATIVRPHTFALIASGGSIISIVGNSIRFAPVGGGSLALKNFANGADANMFLENALSHISTPQFRVVNCETWGCSILTVAENVTPLSAAAISLVPVQLAGTEVLVPAKNLVNLLPNAKELSIFSSSSKTFQTLSVTDELTEGRSISLLLRDSVGVFGLAEVFTLESEEGAWQASAISPYTTATLSTSEPISELPTPPPTPKFTPPSSAPPPPSLSHDQNQTKPAPSQSDAETSKQYAREDHLSAQSLSGALRSITQTGINRYLAFVFMIATILLRSMFSRLLSDAQTRRLAQMTTNGRVVHDNTSTTGQANQDRTPVPEQQVDIEYVPDDPNEETTSPEEYENDESKAAEEVPNSLPKVPESLTFDFPPGGTSILLRRLKGDSPVDEIIFERDAKRVQPTFVDVGESGFWVDVGAGEQEGKIKLTLIH
jgi:hypothetical protein